MNLEGFFAKIAIANHLPKEEQLLIERYFSLQKFRKNEIIISANDDCDRLFFVVKGLLRMYYFDQLGVEKTRTFVFENDFCTNLISFSGQAKNNENIQCLEDSLLFAITRKDFYQIIAESHLLTQRYAKTLEHFINKHLQHYQFMNTLSDRQRVERFFEDFPEVNMRVKDKIIATFLGISPEFFSRAKSDYFKNQA